MSLINPGVDLRNSTWTQVQQRMKQHPTPPAFECGALRVFAIRIMGPVLFLIIFTGALIF